MNLPRVASLAALVLVGSAFQNLQAGASNTSGNPFGNGSYFPDSGTFQAVLRGENLTGVATFSTISSGSSFTNTTGGNFSVNFEGNTYTGNVTASLNGTSIGASLEASILRNGAGNTANNISSNLGVTARTTSVAPGTSTTTGGGTTTTAQSGDILTFTGTSGNVTIVAKDQVIGIANDGTITQQNLATPLPGLGSTSSSTTPSTSSTTTSGTTTSTTEGLITTVATTNYFDSLYSTGSFTAKLQNAYPNQKFSGSGTMQFTKVDFSLPVPQLSTQTVPISVSGVRTSDSTSTFIAKTVQAPYANTTYSVTTQ